MTTNGKVNYDMSPLDVFSVGGKPPQAAFAVTPPPPPQVVGCGAAVLLGGVLR
ncbi:MAG: hypothetical protein KTU85_09465 [Acidimicrobiia bacterium]|nr:hypothetical protein [Acidimicrobiia bacterium]